MNESSKDRARREKLLALCPQLRSVESALTLSALDTRAAAEIRAKRFDAEGLAAHVATARGPSLGEAVGDLTRQVEALAQQIAPSTSPAADAGMPESMARLMGILPEPTGVVDHGATQTFHAAAPVAVRR
jgi:hypothetical protein